ncbi:MAG: tRNA (adenosine(37)-N6)-threonylcarbamoyltransferase complex ATPase subunit type 1 TsaE [Candidatus Omnitrophota bacterium]|jgi:tRNA threonylcarbamoyladenosine biosynthesis protein TsaE
MKTRGRVKEKISVQSDSVKDTVYAGRVIARHLRESDIVCLFGDLGSGKTVLAKGIAEGLGIEKNKVISPTFVIIRRYTGKKILFHFDLYRLSASGDIAGLGYEEYFYDNGISVIEWPERLGSLMPEEYLSVRLDIRERRKRLISLSGFGGRYKQMIKEIDEDLGA